MATAVDLPVLQRFARMRSAKLEGRERGRDAEPRRTLWSCRPIHPKGEILIRVMRQDPGRKPGGHRWGGTCAMKNGRPGSDLPLSSMDTVFETAWS
jgi:hypothetical protein